MKILLLGSGAREHALTRTLVADPATTELVVVPGNPGIAEIATTFKADPSSASDVTALTEFFKTIFPELIVSFNNEYLNNLSELYFLPKAVLF